MSATQEVASRTTAAAPVLTWKTILTHVEPGKAGAARLETAIALARRQGALLIGLGAELVEPVAFSDPYGSFDGQVLTAMRELCIENLKHAETAFKSRTLNLRTEWRSVEDRPGPALARVARGADVIVTGAAAGAASDTYRAENVGELILMSGRPVLIAPPKGGTLQAKSVVIAWKETRESRRAVADALPLLAAAADVLVLEVCTEAAEASVAAFHADEVASYLTRHGIKARGKTVAAAEDKVADALEQEADAIGADLIVCGCYGHSRMNEWLFGGVTRELLRRPGRFVLMSH
jgi:nucleotide-binding universal stress UspA family protein